MIKINLAFCYFISLALGSLFWRTKSMGGQNRIGQKQTMMSLIVGGRKKIQQEGNYSVIDVPSNYYHWTQTVAIRTKKIASDRQNPNAIMVDQTKV